MWLLFGCSLIVMLVKYFVQLSLVCIGKLLEVLILAHVLEHFPVVFVRLDVSRIVQ